jgi:hypothetical protein
MTAQLAKLHAKWKAESDASIAALGSSFPAGVVTRETMRLLVLEWTIEIERAQAGAKRTSRNNPGRPT